MRRLAENGASLRALVVRGYQVWVRDHDQGVVAIHPENATSPARIGEWITAHMAVSRSALEKAASTPVPELG